MLQVSHVLCRWKVNIIDIGSLHYAVLHIVLKLPWVALHLLGSLLVQRIIRVGILHVTILPPQSTKSEFAQKCDLGM